MNSRTKIAATSLALALTACGECEKYASDYSCDYVENDAYYQVYYWRDLADDDPGDNKMIGTARGLQQCEDEARIYAQRISEEWNDRAYLCVLVKDGRPMEKHRSLIGRRV